MKKLICGFLLGLAAVAAAEEDVPRPVWAMAFETREPSPLAFEVAQAEVEATALPGADRWMPPVALAGGTGSGVTLGVDPAAAAKQADAAGWPTWGKVALVAGCVIVAGVAVWALAENGGHNHGGHNDGNVVISGTGNSATVHYWSPVSVKTSVGTGGAEEESAE